MATAANIFTAPNGFMFPDGLVTPDNSSYWITGVGLAQPLATAEQVREYLLYNYLLRPPLLDPEILLMPPIEVIQLYYSLNEVTGCGASKPNDIISRGLPWRFGVNHDSYITQNRIYKLRTDLHTIQDNNGRTYPVLLTPQQMRAPTCDQTGELIQFISAIISVVTFGAAFYVTLAATAVEETASAVNQVQQSAAAAQFKQLMSNTLTGIQLAVQSGQESQQNQSWLDTLSRWKNYWAALCAQAVKYKDQILGLWMHLPQYVLIIPAYYERPFVHGGMDKVYMEWARERRPYSDWVTPIHQNIANYNADWDPYTQFFYSDTVAAMVSNYEQSQQLTAQAALATP